MEDIINHKGREININEHGIIHKKVKDFKIVNFNKRNGAKKMRINSIIFEYSNFINVDFMGDVPLHKVIFKNCTFKDCLFSDHIRYTIFDNCSFSNCILGGFLNKTTFKKNCKFDNVSIDFHSKGSYLLGKNSENNYNSIKNAIDSDLKGKELLYKYFFPNEYSEYEKFKIGDKYYIDLSKESIFFKNIKSNKNNLFKSNGREFYVDYIRKIKFNLEKSNLIVDIIGKYNFNMKSCVSVNDIFNL